MVILLLSLQFAYNAPLLRLVQEYALDGISQFMSLFSGSSNYPRTTMLYNIYHTSTMSFASDGGGAIRNERYKLLHGYDGDWYGYSDVLSSDDDYLNEASDCSQSSQMTGTFTVGIFFVL